MISFPLAAVERDWCRLVRYFPHHHVMMCTSYNINDFPFSWIFNETHNQLLLPWPCHTYLARALTFFFRRLIEYTCRWLSCLKFALQHCVFRREQIRPAMRLTKTHHGEYFSRRQNAKVTSRKFVTRVTCHVFVTGINSPKYFFITRPTLNSLRGNKK